MREALEKALEIEASYKASAATWRQFNVGGLATIRVKQRQARYSCGKPEHLNRNCRVALPAGYRTQEPQYHSKLRNVQDVITVLPSSYLEYLVVRASITSEWMNEKPR